MTIDKLSSTLDLVALSFVRTANLAGIVLALASALVGGCVGGQVPIVGYGAFCGPSHPALPKGSSRDEAVLFLQSILPEDKIDEACQAHDICYARNGHQSAACDWALRDKLRNYSNTKDGHCALVASYLAVLLISKPYFGPENNEPTAENATSVIANTIDGGLRVVTAIPLAPQFITTDYIIKNEYRKGKRCND